MTPKDWFGLIVRAAGLYVALHGLLYLLNAADECVFPSSHYHISPLGYAIYGAGYIAVGLALLRGAQQWVAFAFPAPSTAPQERHQPPDPPH